MTTLVQPTLFGDETVPEDLPGIREKLARARRAPVLAVDVETETRWPGRDAGPERDYGLSYPAPTTWIALAWRESAAHVEDLVIRMTPSLEAMIALREALRDAFRRHVVVAHNLIFDARQLGKLTDAWPEQPWCTMVMARLLTPDLPQFDLLTLASRAGLEIPAWAAEVKGRRGSLHTLSPARLHDYVALDARLALGVYEYQRGLAASDSETLALLEDWEIRAMAEYARMTVQGIRLNRELVDERIKALDVQIKELAAQLRADGLNMPNSPQARVRYIYERKGIPKPTERAEGGYDDVVLFTPKGGLSTSAEALEVLVELSPENAEKLHELVEYLKADRTRSTLEALRDHAALDGRIHSLIAPMTQTGRRASNQPNIQNLKMDPGDPHNFCGVLTADPGFTLVEVDYSNAENWMAALLSGDSNLAQACASQDFHSAMAERYFGDQWMQVVESGDKDARKHLRFQGKRITFGTAYGMGRVRLARSLGISEDEAQRILDAKDRAFPNVAQTKRLAADKAAREGHITLWTGRRVPVSAEQVYVAWNYLCQGGVGEMVKRSIVWISDELRKRGLRSRVAHDMHDALILEVAHDECEEVLELASEIMSGIVPEDLNNRTDPPITWKAEPDLEENGRKWGACQPVPGCGQIPGQSDGHEQASIAVSEEKPPDKPTDNSQVKVRVTYADMGWSNVYRVGDAGSTRAHLEKLRAACQDLLKGPYPVPFPGKGLVQVDLANSVKVLSVWAAQGDQWQPGQAGAPEDSPEFLRLAIDERKGLLETLPARIHLCDVWLEKIGA